MITPKLANKIFLYFVFCHFLTNSISASFKLDRSLVYLLTGITFIAILFKNYGSYISTIINTSSPIKIGKSILLGAFMSLVLHSVFIASGMFKWAAIAEYKPQIIYTILVAILVTPLLEELVFRGFLFGSYRSSLTFPVNMLLTTTLFAIGHNFPAHALGAWIVGFALLRFFLQTSNLLSAILAHGTASLLPCLFQIFGVYTLPFEQTSYRLAALVVLLISTVALLVLSKHPKDTATTTRNNFREVVSPSLVITILFCLAGMVLYTYVYATE